MTIGLWGVGGRSGLECLAVIAVIQSRQLFFVVVFILQVSQILKKNGHFVSITFSQPHFRKPFLAKSQYNWSIFVHTFGDSFHFFFYVMEKGKQLSEDDKELEVAVKNKIKCDNDKGEKSDSSCELAEDTEDFLFNVVL